MTTATSASAAYRSCGSRRPASPRAAELAIGRALDPVDDPGTGLRWQAEVAPHHALAVDAVTERARRCAAGRDGRAGRLRRRPSPRAIGRATSAASRAPPSRAGVTPPPDRPRPLRTRARPGRSTARPSATRDPSPPDRARAGRSRRCRSPGRDRFPPSRRRDVRWTRARHAGARRTRRAGAPRAPFPPPRASEGVRTTRAARPARSTSSSSGSSSPTARSSVRVASSSSVPIPAAMRAPPPRAPECEPASGLHGDQGEAGPGEPEGKTSATLSNVCSPVKPRREKTNLRRRSRPPARGTWSRRRPRARHPRG